MTELAGAQQAILENQTQMEDLMREMEPGAYPPLLADRLRDLESSDAGTRLRSAWELGQLGFPQAEEPLVLRLRDPDPAIARAAGDALLAILDHAAAEARMLPLLVSEDPGERREAAYAAGVLRAEDVLDPLILLCAPTQPEEVRREAARALGALGRAEARPHLEAMRADPALAADAEAALARLE